MYKFYRGVNKKINSPYSDITKPFYMWITQDKDIAEMYCCDNKGNFIGTLFEIIIDTNKFNIASYQDIENDDELNDTFDENSIIDSDDELINKLSEKGFNGMSWDNGEDELFCIFDKSLIKSFRIIK